MIGDRLYIMALRVADNLTRYVLGKEMRFHHITAFAIPN